ncbi:MAG TPA: malto-oligosyltrehalose trehalohydrolase, partial [Gemmatimonadaceae bacterium]|nr:malto-oligosyltrehalose trehalohydrolase [Gemmatimonadaceae bacterium]
MSNLWQLQRGASVIPGAGVRFSVWAPRAQRVRVRLTSEGEGEYELARRENGVYETTVSGVTAGTEYGFVLDDNDKLVPDPVSRFQPHGVHGPSSVVDPNAFAWSDDGWRGLGMRDLVIYELHVGTFTPEGTFAAIIPYLRGLRHELGVTAIEIMPVAQFPGARNWGYDGVELYAVQNSYGGPEGLKQLVDAAHAVGLAVIIDAVYNHVGPEGNYLPLYGPYFTEKYKTPWGPALNYDDADSDEVRRYVVDNALYWVTEYHIDGLRLDAVHGIFDFSAKHLLQEIVEAVHAQGEQLGRQVVVIGESDLNDPKLIRPIEEYGYGLDGQWSDDFHHAVHAALTEETLGYYADFGGIDQVAASLREPFVYAGSFSPHRRRRHGGKSAGLPREKFVVAIQNHDQIGNRASGDRLSTLLAPDQLRLAAALLLLSPYVPLIFMGQEYGETNPFQYFVSHGDPELVKAVREGRRKEFESFGWGDDVPDPQSEETLRRSVLDRDRASRPEHAAVYQLYRDLLALRDEEPMLRPDGASVEVTESDGCITILRRAVGRGTRGDGSGELLAVFNCTGEPRELALPDASDNRWSLRLTTDATGYGGE